MIKKNRPFIKIMDTSVVVALITVLGIVLGSVFTVTRRNTASISMNDLWEKIQAIDEKLNDIDKRLTVIEEKLKG